MACYLWGERRIVLYSGMETIILPEVKIYDILFKTVYFLW